MEVTYLIKTSFMTSNLKPKQNSTSLFGNLKVERGLSLFPGDLEKAFSVAKELGFNGIEISAIATGGAAVRDGLIFSSLDKSIRKAAVDRIKEHVDLASEFNSFIIIGLIRGNLPEGSKKFQAIEWAIEACQECADFAQESGVTILIEMINRYEVNWLNSVSEGIGFLKKVKRENVLLHIDTFHMNIEDPSFKESIINAKNLIGYVHIADSNRWAPGYGHINFPEIISALEEINYQGFLSLEIFPLPDLDTVAKKGIENVRKLLSKN